MGNKQKASKRSNSSQVLDNYKRKIADEKR